MSRPPKPGLDYFSFYTSSLNDEKILKLMNMYGPLGMIVYLKILCLIYDKGYYYKFMDMESLSLVILKDIGNKWAKEDKIAEIIRFLPACELLNDGCMEENVLTSKRIQRTWLGAMDVLKRKIQEQKKYWLLDE